MTGTFGIFITREGGRGQTFSDEAGRISDLEDSVRSNLVKQGDRQDDLRNPDCQKCQNVRGFERTGVD